MQKFVLEKSRVFPYMAWFVVLGFVLFVFNLTLNLKSAVADLQQSTDKLEAAVQSQNNFSTSTANRQ